MPFDGFHPLNLIVILVIALLIFGPKKLPEMGKAIGQSIQMFRKGMSELTNPKTEDIEETRLPEKTPEALRMELEELEREIANRRATLATDEVITPEAPTYHYEPETPVYHHDVVDHEVVEGTLETVSSTAYTVEEPSVASTAEVHHSAPDVKDTATPAVEHTPAEPAAQVHQPEHPAHSEHLQTEETVTTKAE